MKNLILSSLAGCLLIFTASCTSTQFSRTERSYKNGHVIYKNKHQKEIRLDHAHKVKSRRQKEDSASVVHYSQFNLTVSRIPKDNDLVLASASGNLSFIDNHPADINNLLSDPGIKKNNNGTNQIITDNTIVHNVSVRQDTTIKKQDTSNYVRGKVYQVNQPPRKIEGLGLTGMITGVIGLFIAGIPLGILSLIFGIIGIMRVRKDPKRRMGKGFGIAAIILGIIDIVGAMIVLSM